MSLPPPTPSPQTPPPDWYPNPEGGSGLRWWDGSAWTGHTADRTATTVVGLPSALAAEEKASGWGQRAVFLWPVLLVLDVIVFSRFGPFYRQILDQIRQVENNPNYVQHLPQLPAWVSLLDLLAIPMLVVMYIGILTWQHRAVTVARRLGLPAKLEPLWGILGWFVPVINLWFPYVSIRDALPVESTSRTLVAYWWATWLGTSFLLGGSIIAFTIGGSGAGWIFGGVAAVVALTSALLLQRVVAVVTATHQQLAKSP